MDDATAAAGRLSPLRCTAPPSEREVFPENVLAFDEKLVAPPNPPTAPPQPPVLSESVEWSIVMVASSSVSSAPPPLLSAVLSVKVEPLTCKT